MLRFWKLYHRVNVKLEQSIWRNTYLNLNIMEVLIPKILAILYQYQLIFMYKKGMDTFLLEQYYTIILKCSILGCIEY